MIYGLNLKNLPIKHVNFNGENVLLTQLLPEETSLSSTNISHITSDSRKVKPGGLFVAVKGKEYNGETYIQEAIKQGAVAILAEEGYEQELSVPLVRTKNIRATLSRIASIWYPKQPPYLVGVTGTSGKTSVTHFCQQLWNHLGIKAVSMGTLGVQGIQEEIPWSGLTTPPPLELHEILHRLADHGVTHAALEASSIGIEQHRLDAVQWKAAAMINLTREHLDYHQTMEDYQRAKERLFDTVLPDNTPAILCSSMSCFSAFNAICKARSLPVLSYGKSSDADMRLLDLKAIPEGLAMTVQFQHMRHHFEVPLYGAFQAENILCAMALLHITGTSWGDLLRAVPYIRPVPGRMERAVANRSFFVDYAHKPDALEKALLTMKEHIQGKVILVFGCGGNRDQGKRPLMGKIAQTYADSVIVTDDNPRHEDPAAIRQDIIAACPDAIEVSDREEAIAHALELAGPDDGILVAGKGHENYQIIRDDIIPMDDRLILQKMVM